MFACCKIYLFRPTSGIPPLWLPLLVRKHQRMLNYKEGFQRNLPTNILPAELSVKFLNTNHINSFYGNFSIQENSFHLVLSRSVMKTSLRGAKLALRKLQDHLLFSAFVSSSVHCKLQKMKFSLRFDDNKRIRVFKYVIVAP